MRFNLATKKCFGTEDYKYNAFYWILSSAIRKLQVDGPLYRTVYRCRRTPLQHEPQINKTFNWKQFTSTSLDLEASKKFGNYCYAMETWMGAHIQHLSAYREENEVLVPPCEDFVVVKTFGVGGYHMKSCSGVYPDARCPSKSGLRRANPDAECTSASGSTRAKTLIVTIVAMVVYLYLGSLF